MRPQTSDALESVLGLAHSKQLLRLRFPPLPIAIEESFSKHPLDPWNPTSGGSKRLHELFLELGFVACAHDSFGLSGRAPLIRRPGLFPRNGHT
jgi:hypothetical protein